jgi:NADPH:quinone reductase-like Zn-dependent oxidoreductase
MPPAPCVRALGAQVVAGTLLVEIQRTYPLSEVQAALDAFRAGTRGKLVISIG